MIRMYTIGLLLGAVLVAGCGGSDQMDARDQAVNHVCDRAQACGLIGSNTLYSSRDDCEVKQRSAWQSTWPPSDCDGKIGETQLNACLAAIDSVQCSKYNVVTYLDFSAQWATVCNESRVCSGSSSN